MLCGSQPLNPLTDNRIREDIVKELDQRARSDTDQHGRRVRPSRSDLWELQVRLHDEAVAALDHRRIHLAPAVLAWHTSRRKMLRPSRRSPYGKDAVTARLVLRIGSATNSVAHLGKFSVQRYSSAAPFDCGKTPLIPNTRKFAVKILDLFGITVAASAGLCGAALALSPGAAAAPLPTGGPTCTEQMAGLGAPVANAARSVPAVLPGPPVVPAGAPVPAGVPAGPPLLQQAGSGKGVPTNPGSALTSGPVVLPGPPPVPTPLPPVPVAVAGATLAAATGPLPPCCNP
jgi:hypothetical protein